MKQIVIISGKGGTGKTVTTASFAVLAKKKVMSDCDVDAADLHLLLNPEIKEKYGFKGGKTAKIRTEKCTGCGKCIKLCRFNAISLSSPSPISPLRVVGDEASHLPSAFVDSVSCEGCGVCAWNCPEKAIDFDEKTCGQWFVSGSRYGTMVHAKLGIAEENSGKLVSTVRKKAKEIAEKENCDFVIIDGPPGIGCPVIAALTGTDFALIVTEPTVSGKHDLKRIIDLTRHFGIKTAVCINKYDINLRNTKGIEKFCKENKIEIIGKIPFDKIVVNAVVHGKSVIEFSDGKVTKAIKDMWRRTENICR